MTPAAEFLNQLVGEWELTGQMDDTPLRQNVTARWTLGGLFVEMYFQSTLPAPAGQKPYEAVYYLGYNTDEDLFVLHLLDTFGVGMTCVPGYGKREGHVLPFVFEYRAGPFINKFIRAEAEDAWSFEQYYFENDQWQAFAKKHMTRKI